MAKVIPNFIIAGGVATGTSFLSATLANHPEIYLPKIQRPEPNFFHYSWKYEMGIDWYLEKWFSEVKGQKAVGERSSLLLPSQDAPTRLKNSFPEIKIIFCLRNPIERAWGNYRFTVLEGFEWLDFNEALEQESSRMKLAEDKWSEIQPHAYLTRSKYSKCLLQYIELFGRENILFLKSENLGQEPIANLKKVCQFLNVNPEFELALPPNYSSPSVNDRQEQMAIREYFQDRFPEIVECVRKEEDVSAHIKSTTDKDYVLRLKSNLHSNKNPLPKDSRDNLRLLLADELICLSDILEFSIDDWT
jgi:hypothetical protein